MSLIVSKFGGMSLADIDSIKQTAEIIRSDPSRRYVVVSAPGILHMPLEIYQPREFLRDAHQDRGEIH